VLKNEKGGQVARRGERRDPHSNLVGKPDGKGPLGRPRCRWGILNYIFKKSTCPEGAGVGERMDGIFWLRTGISGGLLGTR
jgi:hypothetical protein